MKISKLHHAALLVSNLQRAKQFYEGVLGLKEEPRSTRTFDGVWYNLGENELHLMVVPDSLPPAEQRPRRDFHVAFLVDDYATAKTQLTKLGIFFREGRHQMPQLFVRDPDGNLVELRQDAAETK